MILLRLLTRDKVAFSSAAVLVTVCLAGVLGPALVGEAATTQDLYAVNTPPFDLEHGWLYLLGSDPLGRSVLARIVVATQTTMLIVVPAVLLALLVGSALGMVGGYHGGWRETAVMRIADIVQSFPALLLALVVLYVLSPSISNIILIMSVVGIPIYLRTSRAEAAEVRSRVFVASAVTFGASSAPIIRRHVAPSIAPTLITVAVTEVSTIMLGTASLSFLGLGVQPPDVDLGLMVAQGRQYLQGAWWVSVFPGLVILTIAVSATMLSAWLRLALDPTERWRLTAPTRRRRRLPFRATRPCTSRLGFRR